MSGEFDPAIQRLIADIKHAEQSLQEKKRMVNQLCDYAGRAHIYSDVQISEQQGIGATRPDQYYGKPLATAIREFLEARHASGQGAATVREIFDALKKGGFKFEAKDDANAQRGLRQSLTKNSVTFHRLPNGAYGLLEWYPSVRPGRSSTGEDTVEDETAGASETPAASGTSSDTPNADQEQGESEPLTEVR